MLVKDRMSTHPLTVSTDESISATHHYMQEQHVRHLPVVNKAGKMVGLVSDEDLLKAGPSAATSLSMWEIHSLLDKVKTQDVMVRKVVTTTEDTPIEDAAHVMRDHKIGCLPVMRDDKLVGIITETDIFTTFMEFFSARQKGVRITIAVPDREGELAKVSQTITDHGGNIVACGTFMVDEPDIWGMVFKVRNVDQDVLSGALSKIDDVVITDVRQV